MPVLILGESYYNDYQPEPLPKTWTTDLMMHWGMGSGRHRFWTNTAKTMTGSIPDDPGRKNLPHEVTISRGPLLIENGQTIQTAVYSSALLGGIPHVSIGFSSDAWHPVVVALLAEAKTRYKAVGRS